MPLLGLLLLPLLAIQLLPLLVLLRLAALGILLVVIPFSNISTVEHLLLELAVHLKPIPGLEMRFFS
jgi:hypothetical protein